MKEICPHKKCTGCLACYNACSNNAITLRQDDCGFIYPEISLSQCVNCGKCFKVCPVNNIKDFYYPKKCFAATVKDEKDLCSCASGGVASELSRWIISNGGIVYGCSGTDIRRVRHIRIDRLSDIDLLKGSKYVQSAIADLYRHVRLDLKNDKLVLFIGTPCYIDALKSFLSYKDYPNLLTADIVCHGVPSQKMLNENIAYYTNDKDGIKVDFRKKEKFLSKRDAIYRISFGWFLKTIHTRKAIEKSYTKDPYMYGFLKCLTFRRSCYTCRYAQISRCADFTLCDFWGLGKDAGFTNGKGVSCVLVNTPKAMTTWKEVSKSLNYQEREVIEALRGNGQLQAPSRMHAKYEKFLMLYPNVGLKKAVYICTRRDRVKELINGLNKSMKNLLKLITRK